MRRNGRDAPIPAVRPGRWATGEFDPTVVVPSTRVRRATAPRCLHRPAAGKWDDLAVVKVAFGPGQEQHGLRALATGGQARGNRLKTAYQLFSISKTLSVYFFRSIFGIQMLLGGFG
jgi:hypothetical protein